MRVRRVRPTIHLSLRERRAVMRKRTQRTGANTRPAQNIETWGGGGGGGGGMVEEAHQNKSKNYLEPRLIFLSCHYCITIYRPAIASRFRHGVPISGQIMVLSAHFKPFYLPL